MTGSYSTATVVIPTFNRLSDLRRVVRAILGQYVPKGVDRELIVVDDGSSDGTWEWLAAEQEAGRLRALRQSNAGPARARNLGWRAAAGDLVLFLGDDTEPQPGWLLAHLEHHRLHRGERALAVLGYTSFPPDGETPFLRFINECGAQFGYGLIDRPLDVAFNFFYTSNISLPRSVLLELDGFREDFPAAAWEDIEFAYRAASSGLRIQYQPLARVLHHHRIHPRTFCRRQRTSGLSAAIFADLHPELEEFLGVGRLTSLARAPEIQLWCLGVLVGLGELSSLPMPASLYQRYLDLSYLKGLAEGLQGRVRGGAA
jgi:glycosyltransferase involved in cell wall biosynthesis